MNKNLSKTLIIILAIAILCIEVFCGKTEIHSGKVLDVYFSPESTSYSSGTAIDENGNAYRTNSSNYNPEKRIVVIHHQGEILNASCDKLIFHYIKRGDNVKYKVRLGYFSNIIWASKVTSNF